MVDALLLRRREEGIRVISLALASSGVIPRCPATRRTRVRLCSPMGLYASYGNFASMKSCFSVINMFFRTTPTQA